MILVELNGGLGNQLFQYAAGLSLAHHHGVPLKVNPASFNQPDVTTGTQRRLELENFTTSPLIATPEEIASFLEQTSSQRYLEKLRPFYKRKIYKEKAVTFDPNFFKAGAHVYLKGNRQSEKYFKPYESEIRKALQLKDIVISKVEGIARQMKEKNSVAIHIRRGDYLTNIAMDVLGLIPLDHYLSAFHLLAGKKKIDIAYIFSDDINWTKQHLQLPIDTIFVSNDLTNSSIEDFYLLSQCKHQIIANSTFSWWAAWLNPNPHKIVIAPEKWFNNAPYDTRDLIPQSWIKM